MPEFVVSIEEGGRRLDHLLDRLAPGLGLRGRRRLCAEGRVLVNGRPGREAYKARPGDVLSLAAEETAPGLTGTGGGARLIALGAHLAALDKPAGMHTEALAGKTGDSLQARLVELLPGRSGRPRLLNRLDFPTSGLVVAALDGEGEEQWRRAQEAGLTEKRYLALLEGELTEQRLVRRNLALRGRGRARAEPADHADPRRHTLLRPLAGLDARVMLDRLETEEGGRWRRAELVPARLTLAACRILKGARHQIRAHAAAAGFPLLGDRRYGGAWLWGEEERAEGGCTALHPEDERFYLHHGRLSLPGFTARSAPRWLELLDGEARQAGLAWLEGDGPADPAV